MTKYDIIFDQLQEKVNSGELAMEEAQILNDVAFEKYGEDETEYEKVTESTDKEDESVTYEQYLEAIERELFCEQNSMRDHCISQQKARIEDNRNKLVSKKIQRIEIKKENKKLLQKKNLLNKREIQSKIDKNNSYLKKLEGDIYELETLIPLQKGTLKELEQS